MKEYPVVLTNSGDATSDYLCERLTHAGLEHRRIDTDILPQVSALEMRHGDLRLSWRGEVIRPDCISTLILRRPKHLLPPINGDGYQKRHASAEWAEALEGFLANVPVAKWINHPSRNFNASHKVEQLTRASKAGLQVPPWLVTSVPECAREFMGARGPRLIAKPLASGYIEREVPEMDSQIYTSLVTPEDEGLFDLLPGCPVLFQRVVDKKTDVRLIVVDNDMAAVGLAAKDPQGVQRLDIRRNEMRGVEYSLLDAPEAVTEGVGQESEPGGRADEGKAGEVDPYRARGRPFADDQVELEVLHRRIEDFFDRGR